MYIRETYMKQKISSYIKTQHPIGTILPTNQNVILWMTEKKWIAQAKINGRKAQIHISNNNVIFYTRQGNLHSAHISQELKDSIIKWFSSEKETVIEAEFIPQQQKIFVFDLVVDNGELLRNITYPERHELLTKNKPDILGKNIQILPILSSVISAQKLLLENNPIIEGLVFKSQIGIGFSDNFIIRCRKN
jgi:ATP-dependent DNA ligase